MADAEPRTNSSPTNSEQPEKGAVTLTLADIETGLAALPRAKFARLVTWVGAGAVAALVAYRWIEGRDRTSLVVVAAVLFALLAINSNPTRRIAKRVYGSLPEDSKRLRISADEQGFRVVSNENETELGWSEVRRFVETRNVFVVFVSQHDAQILPKRAFTESELVAIRGWASTKIQRHDEPWLTPELRTRMMIWLVVFAFVWIAWTYFGGH
ncbi:MAG TPA: YcxB family protein [Polyangiaceae bacterium]|nr:YcxB family protein [Polyangiaceae bacterium]